MPKGEVEGVDGYVVAIAHSLDVLADWVLTCPVYLQDDDYTVCAPVLRRIYTLLVEFERMASDEP